MAEKKNPSTLLFWNDLENDEKLKTCSLAAKGLWTVHMLAIAARSQEPGVIIIGDHPCRWDGDLPKLLARVAGDSPDVIAELLRELVMSGTAYVDDAGRLYNLRMVREEEIRRARSEAGKRGAEATNSRHLTERQSSGKHPGKASGKASGKTEVGNSALSDGKVRENPGSLDESERQNPGKPSDKSPPSSLLHASDSISVTTTESSLERPEVSELSGGGADAPDPANDALDLAVTAYNETAERVRWPRVRRMDRDRQSALRARLKDCGGIERWRELMAQAERSSFLNGSSSPGAGHENWRPDFDFFLKPKRFRKLMEGGYDDAARNNGSHTRKESTRRPSSAVGTAAIFARALDIVGGRGSGGDER